MTEKQREHILDIIKKFTDDASKKYEAGQIQHGGNLWQKNVWRLFMEENIDNVVYGYTLISQIEKLLTVCQELLEVLPERGKWRAPLMEALAPFLYTGED